jgi:phospholipid/cholesterol/gamma-HCH transport system ATP-binding protein
MEHIIEVKNLVKSFGARKVLDGVNLSIPKGCILVIMGMSGCGKSTFLKHLVGSLRPDSGEIELLGEDITKINQAKLDELRKKFGILYQGAALFNSMTVGDNVAFPLREHTALNEKIIRIMIRISGGMKKRVGIARALALDPELVFYDEPGAGLDPVTLASIDQLILDLSRKLGITSVVVTHEMKSAFRIADLMVMMHGGKIIEAGTPDQIRASSNPVLQQFISGSADGPIPMKRDSEEYLKSLIG